MPEKSQRQIAASINGFIKLKWLESHKSYEFLKRGVLKNETKNHQIWNNTRKSSVKNFNITFCSPGEWSSFGMDQDLHLEALKKISQKFHKLQTIKIRAIKTVINYEHIMHIVEALCNAPDFYHFEYEFLK